MPRLTEIEIKERIEQMRKDAFELKLLASIMYSTNPDKQTAIEKIREHADAIIECLETLEAQGEVEK
jgi:hypothetical protein